MCRNSSYQTCTDRRIKKKSIVCKLDTPVILKITGSKSILPEERGKASTVSKNITNENKGVSVKRTPTSKVSVPRTVSISKQLAGSYKQKIGDKPRHDIKSTKDIEVTGVDSFSVDAAFDVIQEFVKINNISEARKPAFITYKPEINDTCNITLIIENPIQNEVIKEYKGILLKSLKQKLNNKNINISTRMVREKEAKRLLVTDKQKYDYLVEKYPDISKLKQAFSLDIQ